MNVKSPTHMQKNCKKVVTNCDISNRIKIHEVGTSMLVRRTQ